jgi:hypothetical protein
LSSIIGEVTKNRIVVPILMMALLGVLGGYRSLLDRKIFIATIAILVPRVPRVPASASTKIGTDHSKIFWVSIRKLAIDMIEGSPYQIRLKNA